MSAGVALHAVFCCLDRMYGPRTRRCGRPSRGRRWTQCRLRTFPTPVARSGRRCANFAVAQPAGVRGGSGLRDRGRTMGRFRSGIDCNSRWVCRRLGATVLPGAVLKVITVCVLIAAALPSPPCSWQPSVSGLNLGRCGFCWIGDRSTPRLDGHPRSRYARGARSRSSVGLRD
jgi:hypothetical protein